ncbi:LuxR C-terminal-related transcriptional regulator [uncultured Nocardioides sp.]|uniref:helix-turn-helix transcriptional regulator n=1 Tax=uncultured Nocardioides sp. TaxID=198441 RepID=UPI002635D566|nr:LuxR C-terminal-related transcriptional regulator [uncultured Nocardioides sp.]
MGRVLDLRAATADRADGLSIVCRFGAELVDAAAVGHVRCDRPGRASQLCVWRGSSPEHTHWEERAESPEDPGPRDWWAHSPSRPRLYDLLDCDHLAELPLSTHDATPSLLVLARTDPFDEADSDRLATARDSLILIERLVDVLLPAPPRDTTDRSPADTNDEGAALTAREREVLELLGQGLLARSIATRLEVSERTVHKHLGSIYRKLDAHDRLLAVRRGESLGLISATQERESVATGW